jgi:hypothetical protein
MSSGLLRWGYYSIREGSSIITNTRTTLDFIIQHIPEGELRISFMGLPKIWQLLAKRDEGPPD